MEKKVIALMAIIAVGQGQSAPREPFGLNLSSQAEKLLREVERLYGHQIIEDSIRNEDGYGESDLTSDGYPIIRLSPMGHSQATLVHELMHLRLRANGFAILFWHFPPGQGTDSNKRYVSWLSATIKDSIEHWIFYPSVQKLGLLPDPEDLPSLEKFTKDGIFNGTEPTGTRDQALSIYCFQAMLLQRDNLLKRRVDARYSRNGWSSQAVIGKTMANHIFATNPTTTENEIDAFLWCANFLLKGQTRFSIEKWGSRKRGQIIERFVIIAVAP